MSTEVLLEANDVHNTESLRPSQQDESPETAADVVSPDLLERSCALYLLTLKEKYKLTETVIDFVVTQTKDTIQNVIDNLHQSVHLVTVGRTLIKSLKVSVDWRPITCSQNVLRTTWVLWYVFINFTELNIFTITLHMLHALT